MYIPAAYYFPILICVLVTAESQASRCKSKNCIVKNNVVQSAGITKEGPCKFIYGHPDYNV